MSSIDDIDSLAANDINKRSTVQNRLEGYLLVSSSRRNSSLPDSLLNDASIFSNFWNKRWFYFSPQNCMLYYYRSRNDRFPLGEILIETSALSIQLHRNIFKLCILSDTKQLTLEGSTSSETFFWATTLQKARNDFILKKYKGGSLKESQLIDLATNSIDSVKHCENNLSQTNICENLRKQFNSETNFNDSNKTIPSNSQFFITGSIESSVPKESLDKTTKTDSNEKSFILFGDFVNKIYPQNKNIDKKGNTMDSQGKKCSNCIELSQKFTTLTHDKMALDDEIKSNRDVIKILQEQLRIFNSENSSDSVESTQKMISLENQLLNYKIKLAKVEEENKKLIEANESLETNKVVLEEMLESRDRSLVSLTHEVYDLESKNSRMATLEEMEREFLQDEIPKRLKQNIEQLEDRISAYSQQNKFLNDEIIELNQLKNTLESKIKEVESKLCESEAKNSQIQSKLLSLLKELNKSFQEAEKLSECDSNSSSFLNNDIKKLVSRLLDESSLDIPLSWKPGNRSRNQQTISSQSPQEYDELGFFCPQGVRNYDLLLGPEKNDIAWRRRWNNFIISMPNNELTIGNGDLKLFLRQGVPQEYRGKIWRMLIQQRTKNIKKRLGEKYYESQFSNEIESTSVRIGTKSIDPAAKQIELDLLRTLPNNRHFGTLESDGIGRLRRVLIAYSHHNRGVGYCQGLNRLAAVALLFMPEEDAFWCLVAIVETIMPKDYYGKNLMGAHVDQYVLRDLITEKLPKLSQHMEQHQIEISLFAWFLTIFVDNFSVSTFLYIWDVFLHEGSKVLFRFALAILKIHENELLMLNDSASVNLFLRTLDEKQLNLQKLSDIAFRELNPFSLRSLRMKRTHYTTFVKEELKKIEEVREDIQLEEANIKGNYKDNENTLLEIESD